MRLVTLFWLSTIIFSCSDNDVGPDQSAAAEDQSIRDYLSSQGNDSASVIDTEDGQIYYYSIQNSSESNPSSIGQNSVVTFRYAVNVLGENIFSSLSNSPTVQAKLNSSALAPVGLDIALRESGQRTGAIFTYIIPSALAFGDLEIAGIVPSNSIMQVTVELLHVSTEQQILEDQLSAINRYVTDARLNDQNRYPIGDVDRFPATGIIKKTLTAPSENRSPQDGEIVTVSYTLTYTDSTFIESVPGGEPFDFAVGGSQIGTGISVIPGLDFIIRQMQIGERAIVAMPSNQAYNESAQVVPVIFKDDLVEKQVIPLYATKIDPYRILVFDLQLRGIN